jgi:hypothetical protein
VLAVLAALPEQQTIHPATLAIRGIIHHLGLGRLPDLEIRELGVAL